MSGFFRCIKQILDWLLRSTTAVIMCCDHDQQPPFVGKSPRDWLKGFVDYYEEIDTDHRALDKPL